MPAHYFRTLTGKDRSTEANRQLGFSLAFVAGATNAGGFFAVKQYTAHMSGVVSAIADQTALGDLSLVFAGRRLPSSFLFGAPSSSLRLDLGVGPPTESQYTSPLLLRPGP